MSESDEGLVRKAQTGDRAAFGELVRRTSRLIYARLYLETGDRHFAEDLLQETWLLAYRALGRLTQAGSLRPWLLAIAQNVLAEAVRRQSRQKRTPPPRDDSHVLTEVPCSAPTPCEDAERADTHDRMLAVLRSLPEEYRSALTLALPHRRRLRDDRNAARLDQWGAARFAASRFEDLTNAVGRVEWRWCLGEVAGPNKVILRGEAVILCDAERRTTMWHDAPRRDRPGHRL